MRRVPRNNILNNEYFELINVLYRIFGQPGRILDPSVGSKHFRQN